MTQKFYIEPQSLLDDSFRLGAQIFDSGFKPTFILAIWRGAAPIGIAVQEYLAYRGILSDHIAIRTSSYSGIDGRSREVKVFGMNYLVKNVTHDDNLLIVDDVFDTGHTISAIVQQIKTKARRNTPNDIKVAVPYYKPSRNQTEMSPDYFVHEVEEWLKFPHSLEGLTEEEIALHRPEIHEILKSAKV
ncbi:MAG: phosphoribosyltransferase family protein [Pseudomonadota bacterium]